jgi:hypothetical protein
MATVYLAHDIKHDRAVALKVLHSQVGAQLGAERFLTEIRTTAQLHHPNILPLFDSGEADGVVYYVMPYVEGETLRERIANPPAHPYQSPDGRWTTDRLNGGAAGRDTLTIYVAGSDEVKVRYIRQTPTDPKVQDVRWSPDSPAVYFNSHDADGRAMFWSLPLAGGAPRLVARLDDLSHPSYRAEFVTGGGRLFFAVNDRQSDISVVELIEK